MTSDKNEVAKNETGEVAKVTADKAVARGFEEPIDRSDILIPRAKKIEALSPEVKDGTQPGKIINSITKEELPENFIPVFFFKNWIRFNPRKKEHPGYDPNYEKGAIIYRTSDPTDDRLKNDGVWNGDTPPLATAFLNFFSLFEGVTIPIIVSFCNTSYKSGKTLLSLARFSGGDMFSRKYKLTTKSRQNDSGDFYVLNVAMQGKPTDAEYALAEKYYTDFRGKDIQVHEEEEETTETTF